MYPTLFTIPLLNLPIGGYPFMVFAGLIVALITAKRQARKVGADHDLVPTAVFIMALAGIIGARAFYVIHHWEEEFARDPHPLQRAADLSSGGAELYGGIVLATLALAVYLRIRRRSIRLYFDILVPSMMLAQFFGRLACFLYGCCWGGPCVRPDGEPVLPWAVQFPYGSLPYMQHWQEGRVDVPGALLYEHDGKRLPVPPEILALDMQHYRALRGRLEARATTQPAPRPSAGWLDELAAIHTAVVGAKTTVEEGYARLVALRAQTQSLRSAPVHPAQLYSAVSALLLSLLLAEIFKHRTRDGIAFAWMLLLYAPSRIVQEAIRADNPHDVFGMTVSTAISVAVMAAGACYLIWLIRLPRQYLIYSRAQR